MASLVLNGNTSGSVTISSPAVSGTTTLTLPATSGTVITTGSTFAGTGPAFSAYANANTTLTAATFTKILFQVEEYDTNNNFASSTFTPTVAGYYKVTVYWEGNTFTTSYSYVAIYKNGSSWKRAGFTSSATGSGTTAAIVTADIYLNGSTDYIEAYGLNGTGTAATAGQATCYFQAVMVRSA